MSGGESVRLSTVELPNTVPDTQPVRRGAHAPQFGERVELGAQHAAQGARVGISRRDEVTGIKLDLLEQPQAGLHPPKGVVGVKAGKLGCGSALPAREHPPDQPG